MASRRKTGRHRVGCISIFEHHGGWWVYHRAKGRIIRRRVGESFALAQCEASLLNAQAVADAAGITFNSIPAARALGWQSTSNPSPAAEEGLSTSISQLRRAFLAHHETVLRSSLATVSRYRAATLYAETFLDSKQILDPLHLSVPRFVEFLRSTEISPNGHRNTAKRRLRDKGVRYILECTRGLYRFAQRSRLLPQSRPNPFDETPIGALRIRDAKPIFVFSADEELAFFRAARWSTFALQFTIAKTGIRPGELSHTLIEDVDLRLGWLSVREKNELGWNTKTNRERRVPLIAEVVAVLSKVIGARTAGPLFVRVQSSANSWPLLSCDRAELARAAQERVGVKRVELGRTLSRIEEARLLASVWRDAGAVPVDQIRTAFITAAQAAGLCATCPKSWRHTFATLLQQANVDLLVRQETLGHRPASADSSALGMTGVYTHTSPEFQRDEIDRALRRRPHSLALAQLRVRQPHGTAAELEVRS